MIDYLHGVELTPLRRLLFLGALAGGKEVEDTATGNPLTFVTDLARPLKSLVASFTPVQAGTGDPSPENVRPITGMDGVTAWHTGKNLLPNDEVKAEGNQFFLCASSSNYPFHLVPGKYTLSTTGKTAFAYYKKQGGSGVLIHGNAVNYGTFTITDGGDYQIWYYTSGATAEDFTDVQLEVGESATTYEAPQVGTSYSVAFPATGKNLCNGTAYSVGIARDIPQIASSTPVTSPFTTILNYAGVGFVARVNAGVTYALSSDVTGANTLFYCGLYASLEDATDRSKILQYGTTQSTFTPNNDGYLVFMRYVASAGSEITWSYAQCEQGTTATAYEPYTTTVYGGSLDLTTGVLTATHRTQVFNGSETLTQYGTYTDGIRVNSSLLDDAVQGNKEAFSDMAVREPSVPSTITRLGFRIGSGVSKLAIFVPDSMFDGEATVNKFKAWLAENNLKICITLAEPIVLATLSPTQITALIGNNTMWADADNLSVTYLKKG